MTDWTPSAPLDQPYAMTRFGAHRFVEHLMAMRTADHDGSEMSPSYGYGCQSYVVKNGKCYVGFGWGPNLNANWARAYGTDPSLQGIFEFDGARITKVQDLAPTAADCFGICLDKNGNFAYDDDGWANYGQGGSGVIGSYDGPLNRWARNDCRTPRLIDNEVAFAVTYLATNDTPTTSAAAAWMVKDTREAVIARAGAWPPVLERIDASTEVDSPTLFHALGDLRQDAAGNIWGVVLRVQDPAYLNSGNSHINPANYVAVVKVPHGLVGECEVWWENANSDIPWPQAGTLELETGDPDSIFLALNRHYYNDETRDEVAFPWNPTSFRLGTWTSFRHEFWRLSKHDKSGHVMEGSGFDATLSGGLLRFQDVVIADSYYGTIWVRYPDGTWREERGDAGDETYLRHGDPAPPDLYSDLDTYSPDATIDRSYFDFIGIGPTNGTDLYANVYYTQNAANRFEDSSYYPRAGDWVRWTPNPTVVRQQPTVLTGAIGPGGYFF